jgi:hypothetical protein
MASPVWATNPQNSAFVASPAFCAITTVVHFSTG